MAFFSRKARVRRRVRKALKKYVRKNAAGVRIYQQSSGYWYVVIQGMETGPFKTKRAAQAFAKKRAKLYNPGRVKGRKVKGGRAVTVRNFTGTIVKKADGTVQIVGKGRRK